MYCLRICHQNCINEYIQVYSHRTYESLNKTIEIKSANSPLIEYQFISKLSLFNYASNLGGIISIWFGVAVIDLHQFVEKLLIIVVTIAFKIKSILNWRNIFQILVIQIFIYLLVLINNYISILFLKMKKINWKLIFQTFSLICFIYQSLDMTQNYLEYRTVVNVKTEHELMILCRAHCKAIKSF
jgi:hypothetical protein